MVSLSVSACERPYTRSGVSTRSYYPGWRVGRCRALLPPLIHPIIVIPDCHDFTLFFRRSDRSAMPEPESDRTVPEIQPAAELLPVVYEELRRLAASMAGRLPP